MKIEKKIKCHCQEVIFQPLLSTQKYLPVLRYLSYSTNSSSAVGSVFLGGTGGKKYNFRQPTGGNETAKEIPEEISENTETFLYFFGPARSGTTFVSEAISSHPHVIMGHEFGIFKRIAENNILLTSKTAVVQNVWK